MQVMRRLFGEGKFLRSLGHGLKRNFSWEKEFQQEISRKMNEKVEAMKETITKSTPRSFSALFLMASIPAFYFINQLIEKDYSDPEYAPNSNRFWKYYFLYNLIFYGCALCLNRFNFHSPSSQFTLPKTRMTTTLYPLLFSFLGLMLPATDSKHMVWPAIITQISTMVVQGTMVNKGMLPFWFYSHRHYIGLFYFVLFVINYVAMNRFAKRRKSHPHEFVDIEAKSRE